MDYIGFVPLIVAIVVYSVLLFSFNRKAPEESN